MMAESKKSFLLYCDLIHTVEHLPNDKAGELFKHILEYVNDRDPKTDCPIIKIGFEPIRQQLKRDLSKWDDIKEKRRIAGLASAEARKEAAEQAAANSTHVQFAEHIPANPTVNGNVSVNGTVTDTSNKVTKVSPEKGNASALTNERVKAACEYIIGYLNTKTGKAFKPDSKDTVRMIRARLSEGYEWPNFRAVIDGRCDIWGADPKMAEYLRPVTLFGTKFESYLNADATTPTTGSAVIKMNTEAYTR
jgi:uncharacterized phage protein (TIGR02220 family)